MVASRESRRMQTLEDARESIRATLASEKTAGFTWLKRYFEQHRNDPALRNLGQYAIQVLYDDLFQVNADGRRMYVRESSSSIQKNTAALRLQEGTGALRALVNATVTFLSKKQANAVINHIIQFLPIPTGGYVPPVEVDYLRIMRTILEHQPHVEHLAKTAKKNQWKDIAEFCLEGLQDNLELTKSNPSHQARSQRGAISLSSNELLGCLRALAAASNAPLTACGHAISGVVLDVLREATAQSGISVSEGFTSGIATVRSILTAYSLSNAAIVLETLPDVIVISGRLFTSATKLTVLREEILMMLIMLRPHLESMNSKTSSDELIEAVSLICSALTDENTVEMTPSKQRLDLDDLDLCIQNWPTLEVMPMQCASFLLRSCSREAEASWTQLSLSAFYHAWLDGDTLHATYANQQAQPNPEDDKDDHEGGSKAKRRRVESYFEVLVSRAVQGGHAGERLRTLQILAFSMELRNLGISRIREVASQLLDVSSDKDVLHASWALLCICSLTSQDLATHEPMRPVWTQTAHLAMQKISSPYHCRIACHVVNVLLSTQLVSYSDLKDTIALAISSAALSGPAIFCDTAIELWLNMSSSRAQHQPGTQGMNGFGHMLEWISAKWNPSNVGDVHKSSQLLRSNLHAKVSQAVQWALMDHDVPIARVLFPRLERLGQCWLLLRMQTRPTKHLLLLKEPSTSNRKTINMRLAIDVRPNTQIRVSLRRTMLSYLENELERIQASWQAATSISLRSHRHETILTMLSYCLFGLSLKSALSGQESQSMQRCETAIVDMIRVILIYIAGNNGDPTLREAAVRQVVALLPDVTGTSVSMEISSSSQDFTEVLEMFLEHMQALDPSQQNLASMTDDMIDDIFEDNSQRTRRDDDMADEIPRYYYQALSSMNSVHISSLYYLVFQHSLVHECDVVHQSGHLPSALVAHLTSLTPRRLLGCWPLLTKLNEAGWIPRPEDAEGLLNHITTCFIEADDLSQASLASTQQSVSQDSIYDWDRCESAIGLCLTVMASSMRSWIDITSPASAMGESIYSWLSDLTSRQNEVSNVIKVRFVNLLYRLMDANPDYAKKTADIPSVRTTLFNLLRDGDITVKFEVTEDLPSIFVPFVASEHEAILNDVQASLPHDPKWQEGVAVSLFVYQILGSAWKSLLRRCFYHIVETVALIPSAACQARACLKRMASSLGLPEPRALLHLFKSQLLYTWLDTDHDLRMLPYTIFDFNTIEEFFVDMRSDIVSILLMRGSEQGCDQKLKAFLTLTKLEMNATVRGSFARVTAYALIKDVNAPRNADGTANNEAESRIRGVMASTEYARLLKDNLHFVLGHIFMRLEREESISKAFEKRMTYAQTALTDMAALSSSSEELPSTQQPSIRIKFLPVLIERLQNRLAKHGVHNIWSAQTICIVARMMLNDINPVLGNVHTIRVVRRIRLLVALCGDVTLQGYPLEQLLHGLRPFLTNAEHNHDVIGVFEYLLDKGRAHLQHRPAFFAGLLTALFLELLKHGATSRDHVDSSESMRRLRSLHQWLVQYLDVFLPVGLDERSLHLFKRITDAARRIHKVTNARPGTPESALLLALLDDAGDPNPFLTLRARSTAIKLFCAQFEAPLTFREDVLGSDEQAARYAVRLWKAAGSTERSDFHAWTARVLARAFSLSGHLPVDLVDESDQKRLKALATGSTNLSPSKTALLSSLADLLNSSQSQVVGLAEGAIQRCLVAHGNEEEVKIIEECLPASIMTTFFRERMSEFGLDSTKAPALVVRDGEDVSRPVESLEALFQSSSSKSSKDWLRGIVSTLIAGVQGEPILSAVFPLLNVANGLASRIFPFVLHIALEWNMQHGSAMRRRVSTLFEDHFLRRNEVPSEHVSALINAVLYLRTQQLPGEETIFDRNNWLEINYDAVAQAATNCNMHKTALLFLEVARAQREESGAHSRKQDPKPEELLISVYKAIDEPDSFYGVHKADTVASLGDRLAYEGNSIQALLFRGAQLDGLRRNGIVETGLWRTELVTSMGAANLNTIVHDLMTDAEGAGSDPSGVRNLTMAALQLGRWDVAVSAKTNEPEAVLYRTLQGVSMGQDILDMRRMANVGLLEISTGLRKSAATASSIATAVVALASVNELDQLLSLRGPEQFKEMSAVMKRREDWMETGRAQDVLRLLKARKAAFRLIVRTEAIQTALQVQANEVAIAEMDVIVRSSIISRKLGLLEDSLADVTFLSELADQTAQRSINVDGAVKFETSNALYDRGELISSISILRNLDETCQYNTQQLGLARSDVVATLGHRVSVARLEKPAELVASYFEVAIQDFRRGKEQAQAGNALHIYATFCHDQLANPELLQEIQRSHKFREAKMAEVQEWQIAHNDRPQSKSTANTLSGQRKWLEIASEEYTRLLAMREDFIKKSLNCYLDCLASTDDYDTDAIRFTALWFENSHNETATNEISERIGRVPSRKFAPLMHQLVSKLQESGHPFQKILATLVEQISSEHPYHGMYHVYSSKQSSGAQDIKTQSRRAVASTIAARLAKGQRTQQYWRNIQQANDYYNGLAKTTVDAQGKEMKEGQKHKMQNLDFSRRINRTVPDLKLPPITKTVPLRADQDYSAIPSIQKYISDVSILGGISRPKLLTMRLTDGTVHKELFKSGSDDMRQDSIMEQMFMKVSSMLQKTKATQQRDLQIRTYNVVPLDAGSGAIEFVQNTTSLLHYLQPAHERYHPDEWTWKTCREKSDKSRYSNAAARKKVYLDMTSHFTPVFRHFFFEYFDDPVVWFERRLAYTRSAAANSILGWIIGLGDRHNQNILVDTKSGEMIQIDLGVCFEAGRVLPIPELVPFRLTRDVVDGFGILGTEGVFRRCCEFTLEALRDNKETIMTLLNVLRYDPLHNWSVSPLRARRLQKDQDTVDVTPVPTPIPGKKATRRSTGGSNLAALGSVALDVKAHGKEMKEEEIGEADRALGVVERKLRKDLSAQATVNELIQQATDETNLALLFGGWGAWA